MTCNALVSACLAAMVRAPPSAEQWTCRDKRAVFRRFRYWRTAGVCQRRHRCDACDAACAITRRPIARSAEKVPLRHGPDVPAAVAELPHHGCLEPAVHEAVLATMVLPAFPVQPVDPVPERVPRLEVLLADQVAGPLPPFGCAGHVAPRRTGIIAEAGRELEEERRRVEAIALRQLHHAFELGVDLVPVEEVLLRQDLVVVA